jgi:hypothetical protein
MKKVFLFSALALACFAGWTGCSKEDSVALTGITVSPKTIKLPIGQGLTVTATAVPENASGATYVWTSQNTDIATVSDGVVRIVGVGKTTITVTSGSFSQTVDVEGTINSIAVKDADGSATGTYPYNGTAITFTLSTEIVPANSGVKPEWTSSADNATIEVSSDGLTADVTITGEGTAVITADVSGVSGSYAISTTSVFESAVGYWAFNDLGSPTNYGKASKGSDLVYTPEQFVVVDGPSATKKGVRITGSEEWKGVEEIQGFLWNHPITDEEKLQNYTVLMDARITSEPFGAYYVAYDAGKGAAGVCFRSRDGELTINQAGNTLIYYGRTGDFTPGAEPWARLVFMVQKDAGDNTAWTRKAYINGQVSNPELSYTGSHGDIDVYRLNAGTPVRFLMGAGNSETNHPFDVSTIAVWDRLLTEDEIASLGGVSK